MERMMPIAYHVDHEARLVVAAGHGSLSGADMFKYQRSVWSRTDVSGYDELIDMRRVTHLEVPSAEWVRDLAQVSAAMDPAASLSRLAIIASKDLVFGLGRMFQAFRELDPRSTKKIGVFRTMEEALAFLHVAGPVEWPELS
jgi:hypothetical protein